MNTPRRTADEDMAKDQLTCMFEDIVWMGLFGGKDDVSITAFLQREWSCARDFTREKLAACKMEMKNGNHRLFSLPTGPDQEVLRRLVEIREDIEANQQRYVIGFMLHISLENSCSQP